MAVKTSAGTEKGNWRMYLFVICMIMWRYFSREYLRLQICWHISDKGQSFTFFSCYVKTDVPTWTRDHWEKVHSHIIFSHNLKTHTFAWLDPLNSH